MTPTCHAASIHLFAAALVALSAALAGAEPQQIADDTSSRLARVAPLEDKRGVNPINFQPGVSIGVVVFGLDDQRGWSELRYVSDWPFWRRNIRARFDAPVVVASVTGRTETGLGDIGARVDLILGVFSRGAVLAGADTSWNTATTDVLGRNRHTVAPFAGVLYTPSQRLLAALTYRHRAAFGGATRAPDVDVGVLEVAASLRLTDREWVTIEPAIVFDRAGEDTHAEVGFEYGRLVLDHMGTWLRAGTGAVDHPVGPIDWTLAFGVRFVR